MTPSKAIRFFCVFIYFIFFILPIGYTGVTGLRVPGLPPYLLSLHDICNMFPSGQKMMAIAYLEGQFAPNGEWVTLPEEEYFQVRTMGHRSRLSQFTVTFWNLYNKQLRVDLLRWVGQQHARIHPESPPLYATRLLMAEYFTGQGGRNGAWHKPPLEYFNKDSVYVVCTEIL